MAQYSKATLIRGNVYIWRGKRFERDKPVVVSAEERKYLETQVESMTLRETNETVERPKFSFSSADAAALKAAGIEPAAPATDEADDLDKDDDFGADAPATSTAAATEAPRPRRRRS